MKRRSSMRPGQPAGRGGVDASTNRRRAPTIVGVRQLVITPHISGPSAPAEIAPIFNDNLRRYLTRRALRYVVDRERGY
jgi:phosphoglycerate dehydrogenase-like enzyme